MKNRSIAGLIALAVLAPSCGSGGGGGSKHPITSPRWEEVFSAPTTSDLRAVRFGNPMNGIAAGIAGTFIRTDDGGNTWRALESASTLLSGDILALHVANITTFAVGGTRIGSSPYTGSMAWQSLDATTFQQPDNPVSPAGEAWVDFVLTSPASNSSPAATLRLREDGLLDIYQGNLLTTRDSAHNVALPNASWTKANGVALVTQADWVVCGELTGDGQIRRTKNGGQDFDTPALPTTPAKPKPMNRIGLLSTSQGYAVGDNGNILRILTSSSGDTWEYLPGNPITVNLHAMHFLDGDTGWVAGDLGKIYRIRNASTGSPIFEAMPVTPTTSEALYDISFVDPDHGCAVGTNGVILITSNGTKPLGTVSWTVKAGPPINTLPNFAGIDFSSTMSVGLAVGDSGTLVRSLNGGQTWTTFNTGVGSANLTTVSIPRLGSHNVAFVGTDTGALFYNTNILAGGTWQSGGTLGGGVKAILFPKDDSAGIAVGVGGRVAVLGWTALGGMTVATQTPTGNTIYAAACDPTGNTLYIGGDSKYLVLSTDGGATWNPVANVPNGSIRALQAPSGPNFTLFAGMDDDAVHSLTPGGTWAATIFPPTTHPAFGTPASLGFVDDMKGWVVTQGAEAGIRYTVDGGVNWSYSYPHVLVDATATHTLNGIWMQSSGMGFVIGGNGVIIRTSTGGQ